MSDEKQGPSRRPNAKCIDPQQSLLNRRRPQNQDDNYYNQPLCPCEETVPENKTEYDVAGEWVNYDGPINEDIFQSASRGASLDLEAQMRAYYQEQKICSQSSPDGVATAESAAAPAPQADQGDAAQAEITAAESQAVHEASGTDEVVNE